MVFAGPTHAPARTPVHRWFQPSPSTPDAFEQNDISLGARPRGSFNFWLRRFENPQVKISWRLIRFFSSLLDSTIRPAAGGRVLRRTRRPSCSVLCTANRHTFSHLLIGTTTTPCPPHVRRAGRIYRRLWDQAITSKAWPNNVSGHDNIQAFHKARIFANGLCEDVRLRQPGKAFRAGSADIGYRRRLACALESLALRQR